MTEQMIAGVDTGPVAKKQPLTKRVLESALDGELTDPLGYDKGDPAGKNGGNPPKGVRAKTVLTEVGQVEVAVPRHRDAASSRRSSTDGSGRCPGGVAR